MKHEMRFKPVNAQAGVRWVRQGFAVFFRQPFAFAMLMLSLMVVMILPALPLIGPVLALMSMPFITLGFMLGTHQALQGKVPQLKVMLLPFRVTRSRTQSLLRLGALYALATILVWVLCHWFDGGAFAAFQDAMLAGKFATPEAVQEAMAGADFQRGALMRVALLSLLSLIFWFAPPLVHWGGHGVGKALFFSVVACWRNKGALALYGLLWAALLLGASLLGSIVLAVLGPLAQLVLAPLFVTLMGAFYVSLLFTFLDSFSLAVSARAEPVARSANDEASPPEPPSDA